MHAALVVGFVAGPLVLRDTNFEDDDDTRREDETVGFVAWFRAVRRGRQGA